MNIIEAMKRLQETSESKKEIRDDIVKNENNIIEHLLKCFLYKNSTNDLNHWKGEIYSFLFRVPKLKNTKKWLSYKLLYNFTIERIYNSLDTTIKLMINNLEFKGYPKINDYDVQSLSSNILEYYG